MHFVQFTLNPPAAVVAAAYGSFSAPKEQEIVVARQGGALELLRPDEATGRLATVASTATFSCVRALCAVRPTGAATDDVAVASDAGTLTVLRFDAARGAWTRIHCETFGKTGCRRAVPGQYLAADPRGRAVMVAAVERTKLVYTLNRDAAGAPTISSPLEAHKARCVVFDVVALDVGFDNPCFAALELDYGDADADASGEAARDAEKVLTYYELDLGLNHVTRRWSEPVARTANVLAAAPGGGDGPSGVLVCGENWVAFKHEGHAEVRAPLPRRAGFPAARGLLATRVAAHRQRDLFFFLVQSELGDLYKVTLAWGAAGVTDVRVSVFDTLFPASALCITRNGLLYAAAEAGDHALFQFRGVGDGADDAAAGAVFDPSLGDDGPGAAKVAPAFRPAPLRNLAPLDRPESLGGATALEVLAAAGGAQDDARLAVACGRGARSSLRLLRRGVGVAEVAASPLPGRPAAVWTLRGGAQDAYDRHIVVSFTNATLVLRVGDAVEEVGDSGFLASEATLAAALLADGALVQAHAAGVRRVGPAGAAGAAAPSEWRPPGGERVVAAAANERQVAVALGGGDVVYFELDAGGALAELGAKGLGGAAAALDLGPVPPGRARFPFLAAGGADGRLRLLSLAPDDLLAQVALVDLGAPCAGLAFVALGDDDLELCAGLGNGVLRRVRVDARTGALGDARARFLGGRAVRLARVTHGGRAACVALAGRAWLGAPRGGAAAAAGDGAAAAGAALAWAPLAYDALEHAAPFASPRCAEGVVAVAGASLRIFVCDAATQGEFTQAVVPLRYTPRRLCALPPAGAAPRVLVVEADQHRYNEAERRALAAARRVARDGDMDTGDDDDDAAADDAGPVPPAPGKWASCVRVVDAASGATLELLELGESEAALSCCCVRFAGRGNEAFVAVGTARALTFHPRTFTECAVHVYRLLDARLVLLHRTPVEAPPLALAAFRGRLLVAVGASARLYDLGKRKLLRKAETRVAPALVVRVAVVGDRAFCGDALHGVSLVRYARERNALVVVAEDAAPRGVTALAALDYDTVAVADKCGGVTVLRAPADADAAGDAAAGGAARALLGEAAGGGAAALAPVARYHVGDVVTALRRAALGAGGAEVVAYATVSGAVGALAPSPSRDDRDFFAHLEMHVRQERLAPTGRDHASYRSSYAPAKDVADGDLCAEFLALPADARRRVAADLDRTPADVAKKLEDARNRVL